MTRDRGWYAVHVRSNQERTTAAFVADRGVEVFLPTYRVPSRRRDRRTMIERPLFAGYLFARFAPGATERVQVLRAPGTVRVVGFGDRPARVPDAVIESLRIVVGAGGDDVRPHPLVEAGRPVQVVGGPFAGARGVLAEAPRRPRSLVVEIELLGRAVAVPIEVDQVIPLFD